MPCGWLAPDRHRRGLELVAVDGQRDDQLHLAEAAREPADHSLVFIASRAQSETLPRRAGARGHSGVFAKRLVPGDGRAHASQ